MADHSFNILIAEKYGVNVAIFINNMVFWTRYNAAKNENFHQNRYWSYGTPEFFSQYLPYFSNRQIQYILKKCVDNDLLLKSNFNKKGYDKTSWYSLSDKILTELNLDITCLKAAPVLIEQNCSMDKTKLFNGLDKIVLPIPDTKPDTKPDNTHTHTHSVEYDLFLELEQQRKAILLRAKTQDHEKCHELYEKLSDEVKNEKSFEDIHDECVTYYATQLKPQLVSPQRLMSWIRRDIRYNAAQTKQLPKPFKKPGDSFNDYMNSQKTRGNTYDQLGNTYDPFR